MPSNVYVPLTVVELAIAATIVDKRFLGVWKSGYGAASSAINQWSWKPPLWVWRITGGESVYRSFTRQLPTYAQTLHSHIIPICQNVYQSSLTYLRLLGTSWQHNNSRNFSTGATPPILDVIVLLQPPGVLCSRWHSLGILNDKLPRRNQSFTKVHTRFASKNLNAQRKRCLLALRILRHRRTQSYCCG